MLSVSWANVAGIGGYVLLILALRYYMHRER